jgi:hypothetical protein
MWSVLWAALMMLWYAYWRHSENLKPTWRIEEVLTWILMGLWFGIVTTFHWRAFYTPIVFVTVLSFASACLVGMVISKRRAMK